jgi:hypothetical protein
METGEVHPKAGDEALPDDVANAFASFRSSIAAAMAIAGGVVIPVGLVLCGIFGGWRGLASAFIGFAIAGAHAIAVVRVLSWALKKPSRWLPSILMVSYIVRLAVLFGILYGLHFAKALNMIAVLSCFLALYIAQTAVEIFFAWRAFGVVSGVRS